MAPKRVLIIAHRSPDMELLVLRLRNAECFVEFAPSIDEGLDIAADFTPEIVVIDDGIDESSPVEATMRLKAVLPADKLPVFMVAMPGTTEPGNAVLGEQNQPANVNGVSRIVDQIVGLLSNQEDTSSEPDQIHRQGLSLDRARHRVSANGRALHLTPTEFKLLWELARRPGYVLSRDKLTRICKGAGSTVQARTIDAHVKAIRRKLSDRSQLIETVHGIGYRFQDAELSTP